MSDYDYEQLFAVIDGAVKSKQTAVQALHSVVDYCARAHPNSDWGTIHALDIESDIARVSVALANTLSASPIPPELDGLYFGLYNPVYEAEDGSEFATAGIYLAANRYDHNDPDWARDPSWRPAEDLDAQGLHEMYQTAYAEGGPSLGNNAEYPIGLAYGSLLVRDVSTKLHSLLLGQAPSRYIVVGFDSGDFLCVGRLDRQGLQFSTRQDAFAF